MKINFFFSLLCLFTYEISAQKVHAHNDYVHDYPFWEAYTAGAKSIEADVFERGGELLVAHNPEDVTSERSLENMYFKPLSKVLQSEDFEGLQLLIDFKTESSSTLAALVKLLGHYPELTQNEKLIIAVSGNRPEASNYKEYPDFIQFDHQDFKNWPSSKENIALLSLPFYKFSLWKGDLPLPEKDRTKLKEAIEAAHERSLPIRFWATPDTGLGWETLQELGVDFINTDRPYDCVNFLILSE